MKLKKLIPFVVILAILLALVAVQKKKEAPVSIIDETKLASLLPDNLDATSINKLELYKGENPDDKLVLARKDKDSSWLLTERFNALVDETKITDYLDNLAKLKGEYRSTATTDSQLSDYELADKEAFHIKGFKGSGNDPLFHILSGKSTGYKSIFMRKDGGKDIYVGDINLAQNASINTSSTVDSAAPNWLKRKVLELDENKLTKIDLTSPDRHLVFEKREKPSEEEGEDEGEGESSGVITVKLPEYEWVLTNTGAAGTDYKTGVIDKIKRAVANLNIEDVVDPEKLSEWGMDNPGFKCAVSLEGQDDIVIELARPDFQKSGYFRIASADEKTIYKIRKYDLDNLLPKGNDIFNLPKLSLKQQDVTRIEIDQPDGKAILVKKENEWSIESPKVNLDIQKEAMKTMAMTLATIKSIDYADSIEGSELEKPLHKLTFTAGDKQHTLDLGTNSKGSTGYYAKIGENELVSVISKSDYDKLAIPQRDLYVLSLYDFVEEDIQRVEISPENGKAMKIERDSDGNWKLNDGAKSRKADKSTCDNIVSTIADLEASDIAFGKTKLDGAKKADVTFTMKDGAVDKFSIGTEKDGKHQVLLASKNLVVYVEIGDIGKIMPSLETLKAPEPVEEKVAAKEDTEKADQEI